MNKEFELFYLERFKENLRDFPKGNILRHERPDFLINTTDGILGIEVTHVYRQMPDGQIPLQQRERVRRKIIEEAQYIYDQSGSGPLVVNVHFDFNFCCKMFDVRATAEKLAALVVLLKNQSRTEARRDEIPIPGIALLRIIRPVKSASRWSSPFGSFVPPLTPTQIQCVLDRKNLLYAEYRKTCDRVWLVVAMDRFRASMFSLVPESAKQHIYSYQFDSAFLFLYNRLDEQQPPCLLRRR